MLITTKFDPNQKVWMLKDKKAKEVVIQSIDIRAYGTDPIIEYWVDQVNIDGNRVKEKDLFASKEDLIASI